MSQEEIETYDDEAGFREEIINLKIKLQMLEMEHEFLRSEYIKLCKKLIDSELEDAPI
jgi:hypothetical protein